VYFEVSQSSILLKRSTMACVFEVSTVPLYSPKNQLNNGVCNFEVSTVPILLTIAQQWPVYFLKFLLSLYSPKNQQWYVVFLKFLIVLYSP
jgi:hypothetical protein